MLATNVRISFENNPNVNEVEQMKSIMDKINLLIEQNLDKFEGANPTLNYFDECFDSI